MERILGAGGSKKSKILIVVLGTVEILVLLVTGITVGKIN
jgi:hypothetical protein